MKSPPYDENGLLPDTVLNGSKDTATYNYYHTCLLFKIFSGDTIQFGEGKFEYHDDIFGDQVILD